MRTANYSELRNNLKHYLDGVINAAVGTPSGQ